MMQKYFEEIADKRQPWKVKHNLLAIRLLSNHSLSECFFIQTNHRLCRWYEKPYAMQKFILVK